MKFVVNSFNLTAGLTKNHVKSSSTIPEEYPEIKIPNSLEFHPYITQGNAKTSKGHITQKQ